MPECLVIAPELVDDLLHGPDEQRPLLEELLDRREGKRVVLSPRGIEESLKDWTICLDRLLRRRRNVEPVEPGPDNRVDGVVTVSLPPLAIVPDQRGILLERVKTVGREEWIAIFGRELRRLGRAG